MNHDSDIGLSSLLQTGLKSVQENWKWFLASGIAFVVFGAIALGYSVLVTLASVWVFGWLLAFGGIFEVVHAFKAPRWSGFFLELLAGILYVVVGLLIVLNPGAGALSLTLLMAAFFLVSGTVTLLLGMLIWAEWPVSGLWVIGLFVGIDMLFSGTWLVMLALGARSMAHKIRIAAPGGTFDRPPMPQTGG